MTNGDMIRQMSDEELCGILFSTQKCDYCILNDVCDAITKEGNLSMFNAECKKNGMRWLMAEREEKPREERTQAHVGILPLPCTKVDEETVREWFQKINEELDELKRAVLINDQPMMIAEEAADTITAITSMLEAMGIDERMRQEAQERVNRRNKERGRL